MRLATLATLSCAFVTAAFATFDVSRYPTASELVLAQLPADVHPIRSVRVKSPTEGLLTLHLPAAGTRLPEGTIWGEFDPERLQLESEAVALARTLLTEKETPKLRLDLARTAAELAERRAELERQAGMLTRIAEDPTLAELYASESLMTAPGESKPPAKSALGTQEITALATRLRTQLALIDDVLLYAGTPRENELEQRALELKLKAQEIEVAQRLGEFRLALPFDGEVSLIPPPPANGKPLRVPLGADLALIQDFSAIQARVPIRRTEWRVIDPSQLQLRYAGRGRKPLTSSFQRSLVQETSGREELVYVFQFPEIHRAAARPLTGGQVMMQLVLNLNEPARIIPKIDLILAAPAAFRDAGWEAGVAAVIPGARLLALGETHLAISP
ncbi:hypothetical protein [Rariglobus hedericola]|uniref:HlyD family efflux transporter periplasmic adaptor subunit n=1 Tax=Rariglobus hedericola TaxID=2597822 RepID=A0A556QEF3_9BACT|nr:hypothetical protein [Rariglobus hedericola]TSJ75029.1 hypothetical protein FPL22_16660 [Rariglobus hedericola]